MRALEVYYSTGRPISEFQSEHGFTENRFETLKIGIIKTRDGLYDAIEQRVQAMMEGRAFKGDRDASVSWLRAGIEEHAVFGI